MPYVESGIYIYEGLGRVHVSVRSTARTVRARWKSGEIHVSMPNGITPEHLKTILDAFAPKLQNLKPELPYHLGQRIEFPDFTVVISSQRHAPDKIIANLREGQEGRIEVGDKWNMQSVDTMKAINRFICRMAQRLAPGVLIPHAREVAERLGKRPLSWTISNGHRTLGTCSEQGIIALSYALVFYPAHLRDYVICHELAHLSEMNHSERFHAICDAYCGGRESRLEAELRAYRLPLMK